MKTPNFNHTVFLFSAETPAGALPIRYSGLDGEGDIEGAHLSRESVEDAEAKLIGSRFQVHVLMDLQAGSRQHIELGSIQRQMKRCRDITLRRSRCIPCGHNEHHIGSLTVIGRLVEPKIVDIDQVVNPGCAGLDRAESRAP
jgi:hypothetical protein